MGLVAGRGRRSRSCLARDRNELKAQSARQGRLWARGRHWSHGARHLVRAATLGRGGGRSRQAGSDGGEPDRKSLAGGMLWLLAKSRKLAALFEQRGGGTHQR